jgi:hypothetical protein
VKEQSQIEDMRAAVRGDRERAEQARQRSLENVRVLTEPRVVAEPGAAPASAETSRRRGLRGLFRRR